MLTNTFIHIQGIGAKSDQDLYEIILSIGRSWMLDNQGFRIKMGAFLGFKRMFSQLKMAV